MTPTNTPSMGSVVVTRAMIERAHRAYERFGQLGDMRTMRISDAMMRAVITAALTPKYKTNV